MSATAWWLVVCAVLLALDVYYTRKWIRVSTQAVAEMRQLVQQAHETREQAFSQIRRETEDLRDQIEGIPGGDA